ncbi:DEAD/DEAH box helicase [Rufibacter glacialis]|uniref:DEAD/DEAH box helicase n=1 Tax=Rufibacter glacialis TaxID=1259555 RepID=A0A5M8QC86_9BACT|nr:DEAD/DEAH box helicase [Rufibacter glacialis]KAA6432510.1 DEAD/DEAH box helicase [Rufibacter glacialis]GGK79313.1 helicase [Rufibacter glacialis]
MLQNILHTLKITSLNQMQEETLAAAQKSDVILLSPTGSGKTLGYLLSVLPRLKPEVPEVQALILAPSRELAMQIEQVFRSMATGLRVDSLYGGHATNPEKRSLANPPALLIGTPGRIAYHLREENFATSSIKTLVLDEFDKSLEYGFQEDMAYIIGQLQNLDKRLLVSATAMHQVPSFTRLKNPVTVNFLKDASNAPALQVKTVEVQKGNKMQALLDVLCSVGTASSMVFCNQRETVEAVSDFLRSKGLPHGIFHGGLEQPDRERTLMKFRNGTYRTLVSTDLAARGLDIPEVEFVVHFQVPDQENFTHRNGRTARMNAKGTSYLLLQPQEKPPYLSEVPPLEKLPSNLALPPASPWETVYISAGKKDKVNKVDIVGWMLQKGNLLKDDLGRIELQDNAAYVAVAKQKLAKAVQLLQKEKLKGKKVKIEQAN